MVADDAFSHKIDYVTIFWDILNPEGHPNHITGSKVTAILLNRWILPIGGASSGRVCACSLSSRSVFCQPVSLGMSPLVTRFTNFHPFSSIFTS